MLSIIIPTLNAERSLIPVLTALVPGAADGLVREVIVSDGGSSDETRLIADEVGCNIVTGARGRGPQLARGADAAKSDWLLFLHADTILSEGWQREVGSFIEREYLREGGARAAAFQFRLDESGWRPWILERMVALRCLVLALPYGDQGLLIPRNLYRKVGCYGDMELMEDVALVRRIGRRQLVMLRTQAQTSASRYREGGYFRRVAKNMMCITLYFLGCPPRLISKLYG